MYCIVRNEKIKASGISGVQRHNQASKEVVEAIKEKEMKQDGYSTIEVDNLKYSKVLKECSSFKETFNAQLLEKGITKTIRKDAVCMYDTVIAYSPEKTPNLIAYLHRNNEQWKEKHKEQWDAFNALPNKKEVLQSEKKWCDAYFSDAVKFYEKRMGIVIYAKIHYHEESPHLHINGIPLAQDKGKWVLNWKKAIYESKDAIKKFQSEFAKEVGSKYGLKRGEEKEPTEHKTKLQWQVEKLKEEVKELEGYKEALEASKKAYRLLRTPRGAKYEEKYNEALNKPLKDATKAFNEIVEAYRGERE